jgi:hypothetical protein
MRSLRLRLSAIALGLGLTLAAACGGPSDTPPAPLARHFDDMYIAAIPLDQKQAVVTTQQDWSVAKMQHAKAEADLNDATTQLDIARNDAKNAHNDTDSAVKNKKAADTSADQNRINEAVKELHNSEVAAKAADERIKYLGAYRDWLKRLLRFTEENMYWREAQYELAKASLAQKNNIAPKGFAYDQYVGQEAERAKRVTGARDKAEAEKQHAASVRDGWLHLQGDADRARGRTTPIADPMAPKAGTVGPDDPAAAH